MRRELGIDPGASILTVSAANEGIVLKEPSFVAKSRADGKLLAFGIEAKQIIEAGQSATLVRPFKESLCQKNLTVPLFSYLLDRTQCEREINRVLIASPPGNTDAKDAALIELAAQAGVRECYLVYAPVAAVIGAGMNFDRAKCVVEIGAARTNVLVVGNGAILHRETVRAAGDAFDQAIVNYLENHHSIRISNQAAEQIKREIGAVWTGSERTSVDVSGRHVRTGEIVRKRIWSDELLIAFESPMTDILEVVCRALHKLPTEFIRTVLEDGVYLFGGGGYLRGMAQMIKEITRVKVTVPKNAEDAVARGLAEILSRLPKEMPMAVGNISRNSVRMYTTARPAANLQ